VEVREDLEEIEGGVGGVGSVSRTVGAFRSRRARARPSSIESARFAIERQLNERLSRVGRALAGFRGSPGTTEGVKNRYWGKMTYISYVPRVRVLHDGRRRPRRRVVVVFASALGGPELRRLRIPVDHFRDHGNRESREKA
jgi:hypothetical protein